MIEGKPGEVAAVGVVVRGLAPPKRSRYRARVLSEERDHYDVLDAVDLGGT